MSALDALAWPIARLDEALDVLARRAGLDVKSAAITVPHHFHPEHEHQLNVEDIDRWLHWASAELGLEAEPVSAIPLMYPKLLRGAGPALLRYVRDGKLYVLLLLKSRFADAYLVGPERKVCRFSLARLHSELIAQSGNEAVVEIERFVPNLDRRRKRKARAALLQELTASHSVTGCWLIRAAPATGFWSQCARHKMPGRLLTILALSAGVYAAEVSAWMVMGKGALGGQLGPGWLIAWALLLLTVVPLSLAGRWCQGVFAIDFSTLLKQRLLVGALRMPLDEVRQQGVGQLLGRVIESHAFDAFVLAGGLGVSLALIELTIAGWVLSMGAGGWQHAGLLVLWFAVALALCIRLYRKQRLWTTTRLALTHELIESMVGHRTRLVQQSPRRRHDSEDQQIEHFLDVSKAFDNAVLPLSAGLSRGWLIVGLLGLAPAFVAANSVNFGLAIGLGGVLLGLRGFGHMATGMAGLIQAVVAWEQIAPLFRAAKDKRASSAWREQPRTDNDVTPTDSTGALNSTTRAPVPISQSTNQVGDSGHVLIRANQLVYRYPNQTDAIVENCEFDIYHGDRILLEGESGGGKSTLAALLADLRQPDSGLLLLNGLDRPTWGNTWRQLSTTAPQFHENHILAGPFAFNLLMGRMWPPTAADLAEAEALCRELGLADLLDRMPSGMMQPVGETGWQLSHGERSRVYLARALLQRAELVILDESFAALDPKTLTQCVQCALAHAATLLVIAHP